MDQDYITLVAYGTLEKGFLEQAARQIQPEFPDLQVIVRDAHIDLSEYFDRGRRQYNADLLLKTVDQARPPASMKTIGCFNVDLFIPIFTFIFGQAMLNGKTGIASGYRLNNELYGMEKDENLQIARFAREVIHELGHTFGLKHCHTPACVMQSSNYVEDIDQKKKGFCLKCREMLADSLRQSG